MKKIIFCLIILICVSTIVYAEEVTMDEAWIEMGGTWNDELKWWNPAWCGATNYTTGYSVGSDIRTPCTSIAFIQVVQTGNRVKAICKFESNTYSGQGLAGDILKCNLIAGHPDSGFSTFSGGTGHITVAPNPGNETRGTVIIECTFDPEDCNDCD
jgi:hypothetical protein